MVGSCNTNLIQQYLRASAVNYRNQISLSNLAYLFEPRVTPYLSFGFPREYTQQQPRNADCLLETRFLSLTSLDHASKQRQF